MCSHVAVTVCDKNPTKKRKCGSLCRVFIQPLRGKMGKRASQVNPLFSTFVFVSARCSALSKNSCVNTLFSKIYWRASTFISIVTNLYSCHFDSISRPSRLAHAIVGADLNFLGAWLKDTPSATVRAKRPSVSLRVAVLLVPKFLAICSPTAHLPFLELLTKFLLKFGNRTHSLMLEFSSKNLVATSMRRGRASYNCGS